MKKALAVLAVMALFSSALMAAPATRGNCSTSPTPDTASWSHSYTVSADSACSHPSTDQLNTTVKDPSSHGRSFGQAMKDMLKKLVSLPDTAVWGFGPPIR